MRYFSVIIIAVLLFLPSVSFADAEKIFRENNKAVVVIISYASKGNPIGQGSGFVVREDGAIATNYHVISNASDIRIKAGDKIFTVDGFLHIDKENDVVILKADAKGFLSVKIGDISKTNIGEKVYVIGSATFIIKEAQNLNFAMPINLIKDKISSKKVIALKAAGIVDYKKTAEYWFTLGYYYAEAGLYDKAIE